MTFTNIPMQRAIRCLNIFKKLIIYNKNLLSVSNADGGRITAKKTANNTKSNMSYAIFEITFR